MKFNLVDLAIFISIAYFSLSGYFHGFIRVTLDIFTLVAAFFVALDGYKLVAPIVEKYGVPADFSIVIAFFLIWALTELLLYFLIQLFYPKIPEIIRKSKINKILGIAPAFVKGFAITALFLLILISMPLVNEVKKQAEESYLGKPIASKVMFLENYVQDIFKDVVKPTQFKIIKPGSDETVELDYKVVNGSIDEESETKMLELLNKEREAEGLEPLVIDTTILKVARAHSDDMFVKGYFSHTNREGQSPFDRLDSGKVSYITAGENLALAPDVYTAHKGLMESPGHRANILTPEFRKVGIGVIDGGRYGKMFTQNFTD